MKRSLKNTAGAIAIKIRNDARQAARRTNTFASEQRSSFCARSAPPPSSEVVKEKVNRAMRFAAERLGVAESFLHIGDETSARVVTDRLVSERATNKTTFVKNAEHAAQYWSWWTQAHQVNDLRDAQDYAQAVIDEATS